MIGVEFIKEHDLDQSGYHSIAIVKIDNAFYVVVVDRKVGQVQGTGADKHCFADFSPRGIKYVALGLSRVDAESMFTTTVANYS
jgi:hypothetical protein